MNNVWRGTTLVVAMAVASASLLAGCASGGGEEGEDTRSIRIGVSPEQFVGTYSLAVPNGFALDGRSVYDYLFGEFEGTTPEPGLGTGYELSDDRRTLTITLREGVVFPDGQEFNADTYVEYVNGLVDLGEAWGNAATWDTFKPTLSVVDEYTVEYRTEVPIPADPSIYPGFLAIAFGIPLTSVAALEDPEVSSGDPIESGPYSVESVVADSSVVLTKNEDFRDAEKYTFDEVELIVFADEIAALNALKAGEIDAARLGIPYLKEAEDSGLTSSKGTELGRWTGLYIGDSDGTVVPALGDKRVREAIELAFDREAINDAMNLGLGDVTSQPFDPARPEYVEGSDDRYGYDPERARELLAEAGYPDGFDLTIPTTPFLGINLWEPIVLQSLSDIGINVTYENYADTNEYFTAVLAPNYPVLLYSEHPISVRDVFVLDGAILNSFKADHPKIDELWEIIVNGDGGDEEQEAAREMGEYVIDEALITVIASTPYYWVSGSGFTVVHKNGYPSLNDFGLEE
jgi:peptide/nickel transport system substrate-binding protein